MSLFLNKNTLKFYSLLFSFIVSLELMILGFNLFPDLGTNILSPSIRELFAELLLLLSIFSGFVFFLFANDKQRAVLRYIQFLILTFMAYLYTICRFAVVLSPNESVALILNGTLISEPSMVTSKLVIGCFGLIFLAVVYLDTVHNSFTALELPFLLGLTL